MTVATHPSWLMPIVIAALVAWRSYSRLRRMMGRQRFSNVRPWITLTLLPLLAVLLVVGSRGHVPSLLALAGGVLAGVCLGVYGLRYTRFEETPTGLFYTPYAHVGIGLSLLFVGRIAYKLFAFYAAPAALRTAPANAYAQSPLTFVIFGALAGYYVTYAIGLLMWHRRVASQTSPVEISS